MAVATDLQFGRDVQGYNSFAPYPSTTKYSATLTNGNATSVTVPSSFPIWIVSFRYFPNDVWVDVSGATAAIPAGNTLLATTSELNPSSLDLVCCLMLELTELLLVFFAIFLSLIRFYSFFFFF
jgi:hypothetical protein